jgi:heat shock protein HslJ
MALVLLCASSARSQAPSPPSRLSSAQERQMGRVGITVFADPNFRGKSSSEDAVADLSGPTWQLVKFKGSDDKTLTPDDKTKYTLSFGALGAVSVRIDCNRGRGQWRSPGRNQIEFGPLALTRAMCPSSPLNDRILKDWQYVRSYIIKDSNLSLVDGRWWHLRV